MSVFPDWLTVQEAADEVLGVTRQRVHQLIRTYELETKRLSTRMVLVRRQDVERVANMERPTGVHLPQQTKGNAEPVSNGRRKRNR